MKKRIFQILSVSENPGDLSWYVDLLLIGLIILNGIGMIIESVQEISQRFHAEFYWFEIFSVAVFTVEYLLRIWSANEDPNYQKPFWGNLKYAGTPMAIIDFLAVLPFYLPLLGMDFRLLRILRLFRMFRIFKISRYVNAMSKINEVFENKKDELVIALVFIVFMLLITSTIMYYVEYEIQPENFSSIPTTMWWGIATLTTVGYGDVYPISGFGKFLGGIIAILGVGIFALPAGILASGFSEVLSRPKYKDGAPCPCCGKVHEV